MALAAQSPPAVTPVANDARKASVLSQLKAGATIRVATDENVFKGHYAQLESESLVVASRHGRDDRRIPLIQIDTVWTRARNHGGGFLIGGLIGGAIGGAGFGLFAASITRSTHEHCNCSDTIVRAVEVSALAGGVIGAAIGWPGWRQWWPR
jgi:hypothetical protein